MGDIAKKKPFQAVLAERAEDIERKASANDALLEKHGRLTGAALVISAFSTGVGAIALAGYFVLQRACH